MIPTYSRMGQSIGSGNQLPNKLLMARRALRSREKFLILLLFASLAFVCFGGIFYLPDNFVATDRVREVYKKFQNAGPEIFIPAPPVARHRHGIDSNGMNAGAGHAGAAGLGSASADEDRHIVGDRDRLNAKIQGEWETGADILEKPEAKPSSNEAPLMNPPSPENAMHPADVTASTTSYMNALPNGEDSDPLARERRNKIKEVSLKSTPQKLFKRSHNFIRTHVSLSIQ